MRFSRRRTAISYILEVVMMTLVTTALASVVLSWGLGTVSDSKTALTSAVNSRMNRLQEGIVVEDVQMVNRTWIRAWVRNTGSIQVVIDQLYVNNAQATIKRICSSGQNPGSVSGALVNLCPTVTTKLSLPTQAVGAVDARMPPNTFGTCYQSPVTTLAATVFSVSQVLSPPEPAGGFTVLFQPSWTAGTVTTFTSSQFGFTVFFANLGPVAGTWTWGLQNNQATYNAVEPLCAGNTYTVAATTTRGTTFQGSFTV